MILHCMKKTTWEHHKEKEYWGTRNIDADGFIHCSTVEYFWRVAPQFCDTEEALVLICIDESKLTSKVRYEVGGDCGRKYPHIYGLVNNSAVTQVLPFLKDAQGNYIKNEEFRDIEEK